MDQNQGIGIQGQMPWHLPADLQRFRRLTMGHPLIMGRKTYQSIGRPLPGRQMIVVTHQPQWSAEGCQVVLSLTDALARAQQGGTDEVFVIGGAQIYAQTLALVNRLYLTRVEARLTADAFFPPIHLNQWRLIESELHDADERHPYAFVFETLDRVS